MNEQLIGDLFAEATRRMTGSSSREFSEKFAELIVRECAEVINNGRFSVMECEGNSHRVSYNHGIYYALSSVKKHFGVEE